MAMLAERRQRKRYNLVPKGKALFEDSDRFGTKMLEKMGWSKGKGLGSREDGQQEFVRVRYKNDANGLGFEDRDDQWTEHEKHFSGLLDKLNGEESANNSASDENDLAAPTVGFGFASKQVAKEKMKDKFSGQSLEEKSKNSKARVHYKKFTKGKDMSQYSEKDLANIFGKKATPNDTDIYSQFTAYNAEKEASSDDSVKKPPMELGTQTINTGVSVSDYFKMKMAALKEKRGVPMVNGGGDDADNEGSTKKRKRASSVEGEEAVEEAPQKKKKRKRPTTEEGGEPEPVSEEKPAEKSVAKPSFELGTQMVNTGMSVSDYFKMKMEALQKKKSEAVVENNADKQDEGEPAEECLPVAEEPVEEIREKKKKKKKQRVEEATEENGHVEEQNGVSSLEEVVEIQEAVPTKKKKSKKASVAVSEPEAALTPDPVEENPLPKKKKSKKISTDVVPEESNEITVSEEPSTKKKKNKKRPAEETDSPAIPSASQVAPTRLVHETTEKPSKKKSKHSEEPQPTGPAEEPPKKNKKKDKSKHNLTPLPAAVSSQLDLTKLKDPLLDTYTISTFCAEKFRNVELPRFHNSNLSEVNGYGLSENLKLDIKMIKNDQQRIMQLWSGTLDKYQYASPKHMIYKTYMTKAKQARRTKTKIPKIKVKSLKRKHVFQGI